MSKTALITGASSGIGRGTAVALASEGWHILAHGRSMDALKETLEMVIDAGGTGEFFQAEMGNMDALSGLSSWAISHERIDAFVHCAAKFTYGPVSTDRFDDWDLTASEKDVALLAIKGLGISEISEIRDTKEGTVKAQLNAIYKKADVSGRPQLISLFVEELMGGSL